MRAADDPCGDEQVVAMIVPAMAMVIATRLHGGAGQQKSGTQYAYGQGFFHVMAPYISEDPIRLPKILSQNRS